MLLATLCVGINPCSFSRTKVGTTLVEECCSSITLIGLYLCSYSMFGKVPFSRVWELRITERIISTFPVGSTFPPQKLDVSPVGPTKLGTANGPLLSSRVSNLGGSPIADEQRLSVVVLDQFG